MTSAGEQLRTARLARSLSIEDISDITRIRPSYLKFLEECRYERLPSNFFVVNFVRQYATALELDVDATVAAVRTELTDSGKVALTIEDITPSHSVAYFLGRANSRINDSMRRHWGAVGKVALAVLLIGGGLFWWSTYHPMLEVDSAPDTMPNSANSVASPNEQSGVHRGGIQLAEAPATPPESTRGRPQGTIEVEIRATDQLWVRSLADGVTEREATLPPGGQQVIRADSLVQVTFGNAGGAVLLIDGEEQDPIGPAGRVRHIRITRDGWTFSEAGAF